LSFLGLFKIKNFRGGGGAGAKRFLILILCIFRFSNGRASQYDPSKKYINSSKEKFIKLNLRSDLIVTGISYTQSEATIIVSSRTKKRRLSQRVNPSPYVPVVEWLNKRSAYSRHKIQQIWQVKILMERKMLHTAGMRKVLALLLAFAMLFSSPLNIIAITDDAQVDTSQPVTDTAENDSPQNAALAGLSGERLARALIELY
jgi:hypothetical protein